MDNHDKKYTLLVKGKRISVTKEVYKTYYHCRDRKKYLDKLAEEITSRLKVELRTSSRWNT